MGPNLELYCTAFSFLGMEPYHEQKRIHIWCFFFAVAPIMVEIANKVDQLVVGRESEIVCRSTGSRPPAHITWYLGGQRLEGGDSTESVRVLVCYLVLKITPNSICSSQKRLRVMATLLWASFVWDPKWTILDKVWCARPPIPLSPRAISLTTWTSTSTVSDLNPPLCPCCCCPNLSWFRWLLVESQAISQPHVRLQLI